MPDYWPGTWSLDCGIVVVGTIPSSARLLVVHTAPSTIVLLAPAETESSVTGRVQRTSSRDCVFLTGTPLATAGYVLRVWRKEYGIQNRRIHGKWEVAYACSSIQSRVEVQREELMIE